MQLSRLVEAARILMKEYARLRLDHLISSASALSASRHSLQQVQYQAQAQNIRNRAEEVIRDNVFRNAPSDILNPIKNGRLSAILPERIGQLILASLPLTDMNAAAASPEINLYLVQANQVLSEINGFISFANAFGVENYEPNEGNIAVELFIPRIIFDNQLRELADSILAFDGLFRPISEILTGTRTPPKLLYITTSDPIFILEWIPAAAIPFISFYKSLLGAASSAVNVIKMLKDLSKSGVSIDQISPIETQLSGVVVKKTSEAIDALIANNKDKVGEGRANELKKEIEIHARIVVNNLAKGARINISIDPGDLTAIEEFAPEHGGLEKVKQLIEESKSMGINLGRIFDTITDPVELIEDKSSPNVPTDV